MTAEQRALLGSAVRFVIAGGLNTVVTGALLAVLATVIDRMVAYTLVFAAGIALSTWLAGSFVFRVRLGRAGVVKYVALYVAVYLVGLAAVGIARSAGAPEAATGLVVLVTAPLTFVGARLLLRPTADVTTDREVTAP